MNGFALALAVSLAFLAWKMRQAGRLQAADQVRRTRIERTIRERFEPVVRKWARVRLLDSGGDGTVRTFALQYHDDLWRRGWRPLAVVEIHWEAHPIEKVFYRSWDDPTYVPADMIGLVQILDDLVESANSHLAAAAADRLS